MVQMMKVKNEEEARSVQRAKVKSYSYPKGHIRSCTHSQFLSVTVKSPPLNKKEEKDERHRLVRGI